MATNTYVALDKKTISSSVASITFTGIDQSYTDLVLVSSILTGNDAIRIYFNGDTASNYSYTYMTGDGTSATSGRSTTAKIVYGIGQTTNTAPFTGIANIQNYSNTTTYKTAVIRGSSSSYWSMASVGLWRSTAAITSLTVIMDGASNLLAGSTFSLYGIKAEVGDSTPKATGGAVTSDATYYYHTFTTSGMFVPNQSISADILQIAGGGGGGYGSGGGGGGGAGGFLGYTSQSLTATNYSVLVGAGGSGGSSSRGANGTNSQFGVLTASVGGGGGGQPSTSGVQSGLAGGSGGGGAYQSGAGGTATSGQGNNGGVGDAGGIYGAGGGGAGAAGTNCSGTNTAGGAGLNTYSSWATATSTGVSGYYAGGGGGAGGGSQGAGGAGGGGSNGDAVANTGSGGGGGRSAGVGGQGGSGIVIVRYAK